MTSGGYMPNLYHPVDKGWAWIIALTGFVVQCMSIGYQRSFGMLFVAFQEKHGSSATVTSVISGAQTAAYCVITLIVMNVVLKRYSVRSSCILGCLLQVTAVGSSSLMPATGFLIFTQGVLYGCGHALIYCPTLFIVSQYFERRRPIATTLSSCGASVGGALFPFLTKYLLGEYGLEGALVFLSGMLLQQLPFILLYTPPSNYHPPPSFNLPEDANPQIEPIPSLDSTFKLKENREKYESIDCNDTPHLTKQLLANYDYDAKLIEVSEQLITEIPQERFCNGISANQDSALALMTKSDTFLPRGLMGPHYWGRSQGRLSEFNPISFSKKGWSSAALIASVLDKMAASRPDLVHSSQRSCTYSIPHKSLALNGVDAADISTNINDPDQPETPRCCQTPDLLKSRQFWILAIFFMTGSVGTGHPAVFIPPLAKERGLSTEDASFFLMISSMADMFGRLVPGFVLQFNIMQASTVMVVPLVLCATAYHLTPLLMDFESILGLTLTYGLLSSSFWSMQTLVVIEILGMEYLAPATGFYSIFMGVAGSVSFPLAGALKDITGTYSATFHYYGVMYMIAAATLLVVKCVMRKHSKSVKQCDVTETINNI